VAKQQNVPLIDLYTALSNHPEHFPDTIHPNANGARLMAEEVHKALIHSLNEATTRIAH
jgi:sialate O-acetylesterase